MDIVYTWVDGRDAAFQELIKSFLDVAPPNTSARFESSAKCYQDNFELKFSLRSLEKHAPWFERLFIVTNGQRPSWLNLTHPQISLVTHDQIFLNAAHLPTFSSRAIEHQLSRIPGISDPFLYFNDDIFLTSDISPEDFTDGTTDTIYFEPAWCNPEFGPNRIDLDDGRFFSIEDNPPAWYQSMVYVNALYDRRYGHECRRMVAHTPRVIRPSVVERLRAEWGPEIEQTIAQRFRAGKQMSFVHSYTHFLMHRAHGADPGFPRVKAIVMPGLPPYYPEHETLRRAQMFIELGSSEQSLLSDFKMLDCAGSKFCCVQTEDDCNEAVRNLYIREMERRFPEPSSFEIN